MNLLKGITEELKGSDESARTDDTNQSPTTPGRSPERRDAASTSTTSETESDSQDDEDVRDGAERDDEHVCAFCGTDFAASRGACPDCDAEIVFRGER